MRCCMCSVSAVVVELTEDEDDVKTDKVEVEIEAVAKPEVVQPA